MHNFEQLAGNWQICNNALVGSSETKRSPHDLLSEYVIVREIKGSLINLCINNLSYTNTHSYSTSANSKEEGGRAALEQEGAPTSPLRTYVQHNVV